MTASTLVLALLLSYGLGSVPSGLLVARMLSDVDIRTMGSGNVGATNIYRAFGMKWAAAVFLADALKGALPVLITRGLMVPPWLVALSALFAVGGHVFNPWLGFKGGKGVATSFGAYFAISPLSGLVALAAWGGVVYRTRLVSLASLVAAAVLPVAVLAIKFGDPGHLWYTGGALLVSALVAWAHRENIERLRAGQEKPVSGKSEE